MKLVLLGISGAGKGTQAKILAGQYNLKHISTGDILRDHMERKTPIGLEIQHIMDTGNLVSDELIISIVKDIISSPQCEDGYILDGFPRTLEQAKALSKIDDIDKAIYIKVEDEVIIERLTGRLVCPNCGQMYHKINFPPKKPNICDICGSPLVQREDDKAETVKKRVKVFHDLTEPIIGYYREIGKLIEVNGKGDVNEINNEINEALKKISKA